MSSKDHEITKNIKKILELYQIGFGIPKKNNGTSTYGKKQISKYSKVFNLNENTIRKARQLANMFTQEEIENLCADIERIQANQNRKMSLFTISHLFHLVTVSERTKRQGLTQNALKEGWSVRQLKQEIARKFGTRRQGGRKKRIPKDPINFLGQLESYCETWRRWFHEVSKPKDHVEGGHCTLDDLPQTIQTQVTKIGALMDQLHKAIEAELANSTGPARAKSV